MMRTHPHRGYTLLEMIVSVGVFSIVMLAATGAYLTLISLDRHARATNAVVTNLSFAVDTMARAIRTGTDYKCNKTGTNCVSLSTPGTSFRFTDADGRTIDYELQNGQVMESIDGTSFPITDPRISVSALSFYVRGVGTSGESPAIQPQVTFSMKGTLVTGPDRSVDFAIEGGATRRLLELP